MMIVNYRRVIQLIVLEWMVNMSSCSLLFDMIDDMSQYFENSLFGRNRFVESDLFMDENERIMEERYDFIIIGAGSGGSVVANRLSEIADWNILLVEAGRDEIFLTDIPLLAPVMQITDFNWGYKTQPRPKNVDGSGGYCLSMIEGRCNWPRGKAVGGTSVINFMLHSRGSRSDFDKWAADGNPGWSYDDVFPYFLKSEKAHFIRSRDNQRGINPTIYGKNGYLDVTTAPWVSQLRDTFLKAGEALGYQVKDSNDGIPNGFSPIKANLRNGRRVSASKAFLKSIKHRKNLQIEDSAIVTKIIIDPSTKSANGVEYIKNGKLHRVNVKKEVILSAGSLNSPQLLMLSGIGPKEHLMDIGGIDIIEDLPVGLNLQDHVSMAALTFLVNESVTIVEPRIATNYKNTFDYLIRGEGPLTVPAGAEALAFINTANGPKKNTEPDIELVFGIGSMAGDISGALRSIFALPDSWYDDVFDHYRGRDGFSIVPVLLHPKSRGRVKLASANPLESPILQANYFDNQDDLKIIVRGIRKAIQVASTGPFKRYNATLLPVSFPGCRHLLFNSDSYWECVSRQISTTLGHFVGTCKMGPRHLGGVVDENLKVHGIEQLRVVDASIMPSLISGHTNAPVYMIGEKASDIIKRDWLS